MDNKIYSVLSFYISNDKPFVESTYYATLEAAKLEYDEKVNNGKLLKEPISEEEFYDIDPLASRMTNKVKLIDGTSIGGYLLDEQEKRGYIVLLEIELKE